MTARNPVGWFELYVHDMERAKAFYEKALGVSLTQLKQSGGSLENMWAFPMNRDGSGATGALAKMDGAPVGAGGTIIYFVCDDCAQRGEAREGSRRPCREGQVLDRRLRKHRAGVRSGRQCRRIPLDGLTVA